VNTKRHERDCAVCRHKQRLEIEESSIAWVSPSEIARKFHVRRRSLYSHATALGLLDKRLQNIKGALANVVERCSGVRPSAAALVSACVALSKLNEQGQSVERIAIANGVQQFVGWTRGELEDFVRDGVLPTRFSHSVLTGGEPINGNGNLQKRKEIVNG
jgi:hypothetical protein